MIPVMFLIQENQLMNSSKKIISSILKKISKGFSLIDVVISITIFTIFMTSIVFCYISLIKLEDKSINKIYKKVNANNEISKKFYIKEIE